MKFRYIPGVVIIFLGFLSPGTPLFGGDAPQALSGQQDGSTVQQFVSSRLAIWQSRLELEDWKITIQLARATKFEDGSLGDIHWDPDAKTASIRVLDPADYRLSHADMLKDMEFTVVHELVHLEISDLPRSRKSRGQEEQAVNQLTEALLNLGRTVK